MKKYIVFSFLILFILSALSFCAVAGEPNLLVGEVSMVPKTFYGTWRVVSERVETNSPATFQKKGLDLWNLSRFDDVITLCNLFNGAKAEIIIKNADSKHVIFTKHSNYRQKTLDDTVEITIEGENFSGVNTLELNTLVDGKITKTETAKYKLKGEKIAGQVNE